MGRNGQSKQEISQNNSLELHGRLLILCINLTGSRDIWTVGYTLFPSVCVCACEFLEESSILIGDWVKQWPSFMWVGATQSFKGLTEEDWEGQEFTLSPSVWVGHHSPLPSGFLVLGLQLGLESTPSDILTLRASNKTGSSASLTGRTQITGF